MGSKHRVKSQPDYENCILTCRGSSESEGEISEESFPGNETKGLKSEVFSKSGINGNESFVLMFGICNNMEKYLKHCNGRPLDNDWVLSQVDLIKTILLQNSKIFQVEVKNKDGEYYIRNVNQEQSVGPSKTLNGKLKRKKNKKQQPTVYYKSVNTRSNSLYNNLQDSNITHNQSDKDSSLKLTQSMKKSNKKKVTGLNDCNNEEANVITNTNSITMETIKSKKKVDKNLQVTADAELNVTKLNRHAPIAASSPIHPINKEQEDTEKGEKSIRRSIRIQQIPKDVLPRHLEKSNLRPIYMPSAKKLNLKDFTLNRTIKNKNGIFQEIIYEDDAMSKSIPTSSVKDKIRVSKRKAKSFCGSSVLKKGKYGSHDKSDSKRKLYSPDGWLEIFKSQSLD